jgi:hypothetical protein
MVKFFFYLLFCRDVIYDDLSRYLNYVASVLCYVLIYFKFLLSFSLITFNHKLEFDATPIALIDNTEVKNDSNPSMFQRTLNNLKLSMSTANKYIEIASDELRKIPNSLRVFVCIFSKLYSNVRDVHVFAIFSQRNIAFLSGTHYYFEINLVNEFSASECDTLSLSASECK